MHKNSNSIYIHIPFCKKKCKYCDFYSIANSSKRQEFIDSLFLEIEKQKDFFDGNENVGTIYFGGGTPSMIEPEKLEKIIDKISSTFRLNDEVEITIEINPDDVNPHFIEELKKTSINRLSIGLQSTHDEILKTLGRRHSSQQSFEAIKSFQNAGYSNISLDLIYGIPGLSIEMWKDTVSKAIELGCQHISAYDLTIEKGTPFYRLEQENKFIKPEDDLIFTQYEILVNTLQDNGFEQYEISNFAKKTFHSKHNSNYWTGNSYLGLGPSAHSYKKPNRFFNVRSVDKYISCIKGGLCQFEKEDLSCDDLFNEYVLVSLRTCKGIDLSFIKSNFGELYFNHTLKIISKFKDFNKFRFNNNIFSLTSEGFWISNYIISELFI